MEEAIEQVLYHATLHYRDQNAVTVILSTRDAVLHLTERLFTQKQMAIVIDDEQTLFLSPDNLIYAQVTPPLE